jgi:hypothetical protein
MDFLVTSNDNSINEMGSRELNSSVATTGSLEPKSREHIYSNSHFNFEVLETTV